MNKLLLISVPRGGEATVPHPSDPKNEKNVKQNQEVIAKAKLIFREYSGFALDFDFPLKTNRRSDHLLVEIWTGLFG